MSAAAPAPAAGIGAFEAVAGTFTKPSDTFGRLVARPTWWLPYVLFILLTVASSAVLSKKVDWDGAAHDVITQRASSGRAIPAEAAPRIASTMRTWTMIAGPCFALVFPFVVTLLLWGGSKAFGGEAGYLSVLAITLHANLANLLGGIIGLPIFLSKPDGSVNLQRIWDVVSSSAASFIPEDAGHVLVAIASSLEIFMLASVVLAIIGMRRIPNLPKYAAVIVPLVVWGLFVALKVGGAAMRG